MWQGLSLGGCFVHHLMRREVYLKMKITDGVQMQDWLKYKKPLQSIGYYVYALCEQHDDKCIPFYIGKGKNDRCLQHLTEKGDTEKHKKIAYLLEHNRLSIDILRHGISTDNVAKLIESTCIDLLGVGELSNRVRGSGTLMGRATLEEIYNLQSGEVVTVDSEDKGLAFLLNSTYKSGMSELELFEATRGIWRNVPRDESIQYAYATYGGLVKEVYQIHSWVKAGTQEYFTRTFNSEDLVARWEFIGKRASKEIRDKYVGKVLEKDRSYSSPFVKVGF